MILPIITQKADGWYITLTLPALYRLSVQRREYVTIGVGESHYLEKIITCLRRIDQRDYPFYYGRN